MSEKKVQVVGAPPKVHMTPANVDTDSEHEHEHDEEAELSLIHI